MEVELGLLGMQGACGINKEIGGKQLRRIKEGMCENALMKSTIFCVN